MSSEDDIRRRVAENAAKVDAYLKRLASGRSPAGPLVLDPKPLTPPPRADPHAMRRGVVGPRNGNTRLVVYVKPEHVSELEAIARRLADEQGKLRPDTSEALREVLDAFLDVWRKQSPKLDAPKPARPAPLSVPFADRVREYLAATSRE